MFNRDKNYQKALQVKEYIESHMKDSQPNSVISSADELEKLYGLMEKGIITKEEFEAKKKKMLE
jgi:Short C-terminal domain